MGLLPRAMESVTQTTTISYSYDPLYRVTGASYSGTLTTTYAYTYDAVGNRTVQTQTITSTLVTTYGYDHANRLTTVNGVTYSWDDNGNLLHDGAKSYGYDQANRLKQVVQGAITTTLAYNGVGDRLSQTVGAATTRYVLDPAAGLTQVLSDGTNTYLYGNERLAQYQAGMQYFGADGLGSVRQIYDASGQVVGSSRYDPFGNVMAQSGTATSVFAFAGEQQDATGLTYLRARYYSAAQGRFVTRDVWEGNANASMSYNAWLYAYGNAVNRVDPTGLCSQPYNSEDPCWKLYDQAKGFRPAWDWPSDLDRMDAEDLSDLVVWLGRGVTFLSNPRYSWTVNNIRFVLMGLGLINNYLGGKTESALGLGGGPLILLKSGEYCGDPVGGGGCVFANTRIIGLNLGSGTFADRDTTIHEAGHLLDQHAGFAYPDHTWSTNNEEWLRAGGWLDECGLHTFMNLRGIQGAVSKYAQDSPVEDFAETFKWAVLERNFQAPKTNNPMNAFGGRPNPERLDALQTAIDQLP